MRRRAAVSLCAPPCLTLSLVSGVPSFAKAPKNSDLAEIGNRNVNKGNWNITSIEKEIALGRQLSQQIERQVKLVEDPEVTEYVNRVAQNWCAIPTPRFPLPSR